MNKLPFTFLYLSIREKLFQNADLSRRSARNRFLLVLYLECIQVLPVSWMYLGSCIINVPNIPPVSNVSSLLYQMYPDSWSWIYSGSCIKMYPGACVLNISRLLYHEWIPVSWMYPCIMNVSLYHECIHGLLYREWKLYPG